MSESLADVESLITELEDAQRRITHDIDDGLRRGELLRSATRKLAESSSGSWVGWHSRMYYGDYAEPPVDETWDSEWGALHHFSSLWQGRSSDEVQDEVQHRAGVTIAEVASIADRVRSECQPLQQKVLTILSPVCDLAGLERESELLAKLEKIDWIVSPDAFIRVLVPRQVMSRDTQALNQGVQPPLHLLVEAAIVSNTSTLGAASDFLTDAIRLARQTRTKLVTTGLRDAIVKSSPESGPLPRLERQLRRRSIALWVVLSVAIVVVGAYLWAVADGRLARALIIVGAFLLCAGAYAALINRTRAWRVVGIAVVVGTLVAVVDQLLGHFTS